MEKHNVKYIKSVNYNENNMLWINEGVKDDPLFIVSRYDKLQVRLSVL